MKNLTVEEMEKIIKKHLRAAEADLEKCRRGSNHGRVAALRALALELEIEEAAK